MLNVVKGSLRPLGSRILVSDMDKGEKVTKAGIVILDDNAKTRGVHPRWAKVYAKGASNTDEYEIGHWVLIEHGRWTRAINLEVEDGTIDIHMVDNEGILAWAEEKPNDIIMGEEFSNGDSTTIRPEDFMR